VEIQLDSVLLDTFFGLIQFGIFVFYRICLNCLHP